MKATYRGVDGKERVVEYDPQAPCISCDLPVLHASMGGTRLCPWCDCGMYRDGTYWAIDDVMNTERRKAKAKRVQESLK